MDDVTISNTAQVEAVETPADVEDSTPAFPAPTPLEVMADGLLETLLVKKLLSVFLARFLTKARDENLGLNPVFEDIPVQTAADLLSEFLEGSPDFLVELMDQLDLSKLTDTCRRRLLESLYSGSVAVLELLAGGVSAVQGEDFVHQSNLLRCSRDFRAAVMQELLQDDSGLLRLALPRLSLEERLAGLTTSQLVELVKLASQQV